MHKSISFLAILLLGMLAVSCEKVIHVDLNDAEKRLVIEGVVGNQAGTSKVLVSQTKSFYDGNPFAGISGATVSVTDEDGMVTTFTETDAGIYEAPSLVGETGKTYSLLVQLGEQTYTAVSTMQQQAMMDTIYVQDDNLFGETRKVVQVQFTDPPGRGNGYRFVQYVNGRKDKEVFIYSDELIDGNTATISLRYDDDDDNGAIHSGDTIVIDMFCVEDRVYKYWFSLQQSARGNNWSTPANPVTNITGGALGYFSAQTFERKTMVAP